MLSSRPLTPDVLSTLLWSAFGVNRPDSGGRTAPSAHNWQEIEIFLALPNGAYRYDAWEHVLRPVAASDLRAATGVQEFVGSAPANLVCVADFGKMGDASAEDRIYSNVNRGKRRKEGPSTIEEFSEVIPSAAKRAWARLIKQVYEVDPLVCPRCAGSMRIIAFIEQPAVIEKILRHLARWPAPAHSPPVAALAA